MEVSSADCAVLLEHFVVVREGDLSLVVGLLVTSPGFLSIALLAGHPFVLFLHLLGVGCPSRCLFVLEHAPHAEDGLFLCRPVRFLLALRFSGCHVLTVLLVGPIFLVLGIESHTVVVHYYDKQEDIVRQTISYSIKTQSG